MKPPEKKKDRMILRLLKEAKSIHKWLLLACLLCALIIISSVASPKVLGKITLFGAIFLGVTAILPTITGNIMTALGSNAGATFSIGGTSIIIVVGVALETVKALEAQLMMRHYKGFLEALRGALNEDHHARCPRRR